MTTSTKHVAAPPAVVFRTLLEPEDYPTWLVGARRAVLDDEAWPQPGSTFRHEVGVGPIGIHDTTSVKAVDDGHSLDLVVRARPFLVADVHFDVRPDGAGTLVRMVEEPRGVWRLLAPLISPLVRLRNDRSLAELAKRFEGTAHR